MTTDYKVTELFCIIDEFCKYFEAENAGNLLEDSSDIKRRRRSVSLSDSEIMTILLYFIQKIEDKKSQNILYPQLNIVPLQPKKFFGWLCKCLSTHEDACIKL